MALNKWIIWIICIGVSMAEIKIENVALCGVATQKNMAHGWVAPNAIDGDRSQCSHTENTSNPWWTVDLKEIYAITNITVINRRNCCPERLIGAQIRVENSPNNNGNGNAIVATIDGNDTIQNFTMPEGLVGRYVNVSIPGDGKILALCEVEVYGHPINTCEFQNNITCSHGAAHLLMPNLPNLFIANNFSQVFCHDGGVEKLGILANLTTFFDGNTKKKWPGIEKRDGSVVLHLTKELIGKDKNITVLNGNDCTHVVHQTKGDCNSVTSSGSCTMQCLETDIVCADATYNENTCRGLMPKDTYFVFVKPNNVTCINCNNPAKKPKENIKLNDVLPNVNLKRPGPLDAKTADEVMRSFTSDFVDKFNESSVAFSLGETVTGILLKQLDPQDLEEVSLGYSNITEGFSILDDRTTTSQFAKSITVSKEAFEVAKSLNVTNPFATVFTFLNMSKDKYNNSVLGDQVIAIEMGALVCNLSDKININFRNQQFKGKPACHSWKGNGSLPVWTSDGCETVHNGSNITCRCTHLTFFAVLLTPLNETTSSSDLNTLTIISRVGCGVSMFFLGIVLFMHFVWRRTASSNSSKILIQLVLAMFLLDFTFLINDFVAKTKHVIGCMIMAASMHYFMLSTFSWFAAHALHLCLQLYNRGKIQIQHYILKVSITSWVMPSVIEVVLLSIGKYGEVVINTENTATSVAMCWILDNDVHYIVNIGYYAVVFLFTFSTFILMLTWLYCVKRGQKAPGSDASSCQRVVSIMGLCCVLGVTWGCAFFAYGVFRLPAYYCFTILNSFQGFCLFIYYYKSSRVVVAKDPHNSSGSSNTLKTSLDEIFNPYENYSAKPKPE